MDEALLSALAPPQRLALAYAPRSSKGALLGLLLLDARLAGVLRNSREPMLAQLRLAWWREHLTGAGQALPASDPLLGLLATWPGPRSALAGLVQGWEAMTGATPLPGEAIANLAEARAEAFAVLADKPAIADAARRMARAWALADIAGHLSDPRECQTALSLAREADWTPARLPRTLRPLAVLHALAARAIRLESPEMNSGPRALVSALRIGLFGR